MKNMHLMPVLGLLLLAAACTPGRAATSTGGQVNFELACDSSDTHESSTLYCMRMDTRTGDILRVDLSKLPRSSGPTKAPEGPSGLYQLVCDSTDTETRSDFRCLRVNRQTGEILLVDLPKVGVFPQ